MSGKRIAGSLGALAVAALLLTTVLRLPGFTHQLFDPDEAAIATEAIAVNHGGTLYTDATDRKPPLVPILYAASFKATDTTDLRWPHALASLAIAATGLVLALDMRRRHGNAEAWWALVLTIAGVVAFFPVDGQSANYSHFALLPGAIAVVLARRGRSSTAFMAGLALGVAVLCRQTWIIGAVGGTVGAVVAGRKRDAFWFLLGTAAAIASVALYVPFGGFWHWTFTGNGGFLREGEALSRAVVDYLASLGTFVGLHVTLVAAVVVAVIAFVHASRRARIEQLDLWLWLGGALIAEAAGLRFFGHYWIQALPPLVLLTAPLLAAATRRIQTWAAVGVAIPTVLAVAAAFTPSTFRTLPNATPLANYVRTTTQPDDPILVWGSFPEVYWESDRPPAGALVLSDFVTGRSGGRPTGKATLSYATPGAYDLMLRRLRECPPALVLDTSTANIRGYARYPIAHFTKLADFLRSNGYVATGKIEGVTILRPKDASTVCSFPKDSRYQQLLGLGPRP
ncbi:MAG TPA: hypothetical protein VGO03_05420 [Acidimicrobiia bacterium]